MQGQIARLEKENQRLQKTQAVVDQGKRYNTF